MYHDDLNTPKTRAKELIEKYVLTYGLVYLAGVVFASIFWQIPLSDFNNRLNATHSTVQQRDAEIAQLNIQLASLKDEIEKSKKATPTPTQSDTPKLIEEALKERSLSKLSSIMAEQVTLTVLNSPCCGTVSKSEAADKLKIYILSNSVWSIGSNNPLASKYISSSPENFKEAVIAISDQKYVLGFKLNAQNQISHIAVAKSN